LNALQAPSSTGSISAIVRNGRQRVRVTVSAGAVTDVDLVAMDAQDPEAPPQAGGPDAALLAKAATQLQAYLAGARRDFSVPVRQPGTLFQDRVWRALQDVPYGQTVTYAELAAKAGHPKAVRAVGGALNKNRLPILVPCHRVLASEGLGGFACGREWKMALLGIEGATLPLG
jgi:methylated-DNA-[protein]-cysteine S-methyltransferase